MYETGDSPGTVSLRSLLAGEAARAPATDMDLRGLVARMVRGGFPGAVDLPHAAAVRFNSDYLDQISRVDIDFDDRLDHDPAKVSTLLRSLARNTATEARVATLVSDVAGADGGPSRSTVERYLASLRKVFILEEQPAWSPGIRSAAVLRTAPKRHLVDVCLAAAALNVDETRLMRDLNTLGLFFESFVHQHLLAYAAVVDAHVFHYRDSNGLEVDAVIQTRAGDWVAAEVKLGPGQVDAAAERLLKLAKLVDGQPAAGLVVIVPTGFAYTRQDGVRVVPLSLLGP